MTNIHPSLCQKTIYPTQSVSHSMYQSSPTSNKSSNNSRLFLIIVMTLSTDIVESAELITTGFNQSGENFIALNRKNDTVLRLKHVGTT